jgi:hypothetical protein
MARAVSAREAVWHFTHRGERKALRARREHAHVAGP